MSAYAASIFVFRLIRANLVAHHALASSTAAKVRGILRFAGLDVGAVHADCSGGRFVEIVT